MEESSRPSYSADVFVGSSANILIFILLAEDCSIGVTIDYFLWCEGCLGSFSTLKGFLRITVVQVWVKGPEATYPIPYKWNRDFCIQPFSNGCVTRRLIHRSQTWAKGSADNSQNFCLQLFLNSCVNTVLFLSPNFILNFTVFKPSNRNHQANHPFLICSIMYSTKFIGTILIIVTLYLAYSSSSSLLDLVYVHTLNGPSHVVSPSYLHRILCSSTDQNLLSILPQHCSITPQRNTYAIYIGTKNHSTSLSTIMLRHTTSTYSFITQLHKKQYPIKYETLSFKTLFYCTTHNSHWHRNHNCLIFVYASTTHNNQQPTQEEGVSRNRKQAHSAVTAIVAAAVVTAVMHHSLLILFVDICLYGWVIPSQNYFCVPTGSNYFNFERSLIMFADIHCYCYEIKINIKIIIKNGNIN